MTRWEDYEPFVHCSCGKRFWEHQTAELWQCAKLHAQERVLWSVQMMSKPRQRTTIRVDARTYERSQSDLIEHLRRRSR